MSNTKAVAAAFDWWWIQRQITDEFGEQHWVELCRCADESDADTILHDHELAANQRTAVELVHLLQEDRVRAEARLIAVEAEAAALRELVRELTRHIVSQTYAENWPVGALARAESLLSEKAETPATAGEG